MLIGNVEGGRSRGRSQIKLLDQVKPFGGISPT